MGGGKEGEGGRSHFCPVSLSSKSVVCVCVCVCLCVVFEAHIGASRSA